VAAGKAGAAAVGVGGVSSEPLPEEVCDDPTGVGVVGVGEDVLEERVGGDAVVEGVYEAPDGPRVGKGVDPKARRGGNHSPSVPEEGSDVHSENLCRPGGGARKMTFNVRHN
jgi:hypothetical protein